MTLFKRYYFFLKRISSWTTWGISLALVVVIFLVMNNNSFGIGYIRQVSGGAEILDSYFYYPPQKAYQVLDTLGEAGRAAYLNVNLMDFLFPLVYTAFFCISMSMTYTFIYPVERKRNWLLWLPLATLLADYGENICIRLMLLNYPAPLSGVSLGATLLTPLKSILLVVASLLILQGNIKVTNQLFAKKK